MHSAYLDLFHRKREEFLSSLEKVKEVQETILTDIIAKNQNTGFGQIYNFKSIKSVSDFQKQIPVSTYADYEGFIDEILDGKKNILTSEDVLLLEPTSGSTSVSKLIPYTKGLKAAFNKGIEPWLSDLYLNFPQILNKPSYWSITPSLKSEQSSTKVKIGFANDFEYLSEDFAKIVSENLVISSIITENIEEFKRKTALCLELTSELSFVSFWNPSFFMILIDLMGKKPSELWKNLEVISCWDDANAKFYADKLKKTFPNVYIQGKGLLATEGIMTIPIENIGKLPCVNSHFFEFIDTTTEEIRLLHELELNKSYSILLTTQGGLYRYEIGDIVRVYEFYKNCPLLKFTGKKDNVSDYVGEKISEKHIKQIIEKLDISRLSLFYLFAPKKKDDNFFYTLYLEPNREIDIGKLEKKIESELLENFHYEYARKLGQIKPFKLQIVRDGSMQYLDICTKKGQKLGDIKPINFSNCPNWNFNIQ